jgi:hypothetical protein
MLTPTGKRNHKHTLNKKNKIMGTQFLRTQVEVKKKTSRFANSFGHVLSVVLLFAL